jgi:hypothetical protein
VLDRAGARDLRSLDSVRELLNQGASLDLGDPGPQNLCDRIVLLPYKLLSKQFLRGETRDSVVELSDPLIKRPFQAPLHPLRSIPVCRAQWYLLSRA